MVEVVLQDVSKAYAGKTVLRHLDLVIPPGSFTCLLGSSGSGKTTLLKLLAGLETPDTGQIWLNGLKASEQGRILVPPHARRVGYIFQDLALWPHLTAFDNIAFGLKINKVPAYADRVNEMAERLNIRESLFKYPGQLSGGQQQLVAIARSLVLQPQWLLLDEPMANLDVKLKKLVRNKIITLIEDFNLNMVYVTHDHHEAFALADQLVILNEGRIEATGSPDQIRGSENEFIRYFIEA
jgi:ABC-type Fe3+/spermidine/putrescine transport system ATPase subunit